MQEPPTSYLDKIAQLPPQTSIAAENTYLRRLLSEWEVWYREQKAYYDDLFEQSLIRHHEQEARIHQLEAELLIVQRKSNQDAP